jgi:hypothetical protein
MMSTLMCCEVKVPAMATGKAVTLLKDKAEAQLIAEGFAALQSNPKMSKVIDTSLLTHSSTDRPRADSAPTPSTISTLVNTKCISMIRLVGTIFTFYLLCATEEYLQDLKTYLNESTAPWSLTRTLGTLQMQMQMQMQMTRPRATTSDSNSSSSSSSDDPQTRKDSIWPVVYTLSVSKKDVKGNISVNSEFDLLNPADRPIILECLDRLNTFIAQQAKEFEKSLTP